MKFKSVGKSLLAAMVLGMTLSLTPADAWAETTAMQQQQQYGTVKGVVTADNGEAMFGAVVYVVGTTNSSAVDFDGNYELQNVKIGSTIRATLMGYTCADQIWNGGVLNFVMKEEAAMLDEIVVTAMGIMRKEKSLTYATQMVKADDLFKAPDANLINSLEGKVSGITITPSAGGAGGASKITLRGNKSIMGDNAPLIVVDGVPMTNSIRGQIGDAANLTYSGASEGSDPLSMINPDDIESMNILKGANAAALYGSRAANGVIMITTKKGKEGKMEITFNSSTTFDKPLLTPELQNSYGGYRAAGNGSLIFDSWGDRLSGTGKHIYEYTGDKQYFPQVNEDGTPNILKAHLRNYANDDIDDFYDWALNATNSISISGGTEKIQTYGSFSNTHSKGMIETNRYNRNTFAFRQTYNLWERLTMNLNVNYNQAKTKNRVGGGTVGNPIYHLYTTPRDVDMEYYKDNYAAQGQWWSSGDQEGNGTQSYFQDIGGLWMEFKDHVLLNGPMQQYAFQSPMQNNPYWLTNMNQGETNEERFSASFSATYKILEGLNLQGRVSIDHTKYKDEGGTYASTWGPVEMYRYGTYYLNNSRTNEIYTDYMLSYNKQLSKDWAISASVGYVGHTIKSDWSNTYIGEATNDPTRGGSIALFIPDAINKFDPSFGRSGVTTKGKSSNWDQAALITAQVGWKDVIFIDGSYRRDWYRTFKQFEHLGTDDNYGYFGFGANAILSDIFKLPKWFTYAKYRLSYSEVGNSIPNVSYFDVNTDTSLGTAGVTSRNRFVPIPEKTKSFETGLEMQFLRDCLTFDITYYNSAMHNSYLEIAGTNGKMQPVNSGIIRNQGIEMTLGYDWKINKNLRWKTSVNFSYNHNEIEETAKDKYGNSKDMATSFANGKIQLLYRKGGSYGDIYITDFTRYKEDVYVEYRPEQKYDEANNPLFNADGTPVMIDVPYYNTEGNGELANKAGDIYITNGKPSLGGYATAASNGKIRVYEANKKFQKYAGNVNSKYQLSWSNTLTWKDFSLYFLINGRIGGKVVSLTEGYLDEIGSSKRTGDARLYAEANNIYTEDGRHGMYLNEGRNLVAVEDYYTFIGGSDASSYIYNATNFRLRELSLGYTFRDLFGENKNLNVSFVCRNLFFLYKDSPVDPDVSLSTANGLGGIDVFNYPSARSFGINLKVNL